MDAKGDYTVRGEPGAGRVPGGGAALAAEIFAATGSTLADSAT